VVDLLTHPPHHPRMDRRRFLLTTVACVLTWPLAAHAQEKRRIPTIGVLWHAANAEEEGPLFKGLLGGFRTLGYVEGRSIRLEHRFPNEMPERFKRMANELVALNVDVLVSAGTQAALALRDATKTIPVVFMFIPDRSGTNWWTAWDGPAGT
jgi:ABC-type uncharacterized transport system substrate-binding protein